MLDRLVTEMYARGLSNRDVEDAFRDATGQLLISRSAVSEMTDQLWVDYQVSSPATWPASTWSTCSPMRCSSRCAGSVRRSRCWSAGVIASDGRKHLLHPAVGNKESEACWTGFFRYLLERGLRAPTTVTSDGAPGPIAAIDATLRICSASFGCRDHRPDRSARPHAVAWTGGGVLDVHNFVRDPRSATGGRSG